MFLNLKDLAAEKPYFAVIVVMTCMNKNVVSFLGFLVLFVTFFNGPAEGQWRRKKVPEVKVINYYTVDTLIAPVPRTRQSFHERIDREQKKATAGSADRRKIYYFEDTALNNMLTKAILKDVDRMQVLVENMPDKARDANSDNQFRIRCLQALTDMLVRYNADTRIDAYYYKKLSENMREMIISFNENMLMAFTKDNISVYTLDNSKMIYAQSPDERTLLYTEMAKQDPKMMIKRLGDYANEPFSCDIISAAARTSPGDVFNFASSTNFILRNSVRRCDDRLVQTIVTIADKSRSPLKALPFLGDIYSRSKTIEEIDEITADTNQFYKNLVRLKIEHSTIGGDTYSDELAYRSLAYVREMDELHEAKDTVRFHCIDGLSPEALYFIMVYGQDEIYTSSFIGCFKRMIQRMQPMTGTQFLEYLHYDHFRTFIRMCAGYNTLSDFLHTMEEEKKLQLMKDFIAGLQKGKENDLEDAVDVADAYGSIKDSTLKVFLQQQVKTNYEVSYKENSKKGLIIYSLLSVLFEGSKSAENDQAAKKQSDKLGLPPIFKVPYQSLLGDTTAVFEQFFFFGDKDGKTSFTSFLGNFKDGRWKIINDQYWTTITSTKGKPVIIYANQPLDEPQDEDAQNRLSQYLTENHIHPTIIVHRGHSYHLPVTMEKLSKQNKIVVLGSCGGYHNLAVVLDRAPDAHIISSKQTGTMAVNEPIIKEINNSLLEGRDINWISMWKDLEGYFTKKPDVKDKFDDYVPPYRNLGAIFIKSYRHMINMEE